MPLRKNEKNGFAGSWITENGNDAPGGIGAGWLRFHTRNRIIVKSVATGVFPAERRPGRLGIQDMEGSYESGCTLRTENQNRS